MMKNLATYQIICNRCVMDTTDPDIIFDEHGHCNHCTSAIERLKQPPYGLSPKEKEKALNQLIDNIKKAGKGKKYDCVIGLSGGVDSSYVAYLVKKWGLRPLAMHLNNGWNTKEGEQNVEIISEMLGIELNNIVLDWENFKDLQQAFLRASTPDSEIPTDNIILKALYSTADKHGIKYILSGFNLSSESILPPAWSQGHLDKKYIKAVYKQYGTQRKLKFSLFSYYQLKLYPLIKHIKVINILDYVAYDKERSKEMLIRELNWKNYGRKHGESIYTKIFQEYILPQKFGYDKRKAHYSSLIVAGQLSRGEALEKMKEPLYKNEVDLQNDISLFCNKLGISIAEFEQIMRSPHKTIHDYPNTPSSFSYKLLRMLYKILK